MAGLAQDAGTGEPRRLARLMVLLLGCVTLVIIAAIVPVSVMAHQNPLASAGTGLALGIPFGAAGVVVLRRQPRNPIGWLSLARPGASAAAGPGRQRVTRLRRAA